MPSQPKYLLFAALLSVAPNVLSQDISTREEPEVTIIQERLFDKKREIGVNLGYLPDDNFYESFPISVNFIHHFNERYAWEVIRASYMLNSERDIKQDLEENFGVTPSTFDELTSHIETSFIVKPTYGKDSLWNKHILNHEGFVTFGAGVATFEKKLSYGDPEQESALTASIGIGRKYFVGKNFNVSLELKNIVMFKESNIENYIFLGIGLNFRFDLFGSMKKNETEDNSIYKYLE